MIRYMFDTNAASAVIKARPRFQERLDRIAISDVAISSIVEGELWFGVAQRPRNRSLEEAVAGFLAAVDVLAWGGAAARAYGVLRSKLWSLGRSLGPLDSLIAAHALAEDAILVTRDRAFARVPGLTVEDWEAA